MSSEFKAICLICFTGNFWEKRKINKYISLIWNIQKKFQIGSRLCGWIGVRFKTLQLWSYCILQLSLRDFLRYLEIYQEIWELSFLSVGNLCLYNNSVAKFVTPLIFLLSTVLPLLLTSSDFWHTLCFVGCCEGFILCGYTCVFHKVHPPVGRAETFWLAAWEPLGLRYSEGKCA